MNIGDSIGMGAVCFLLGISAGLLIGLKFFDYVLGLKLNGKPLPRWLCWYTKLNPDWTRRSNR